MKDETTFGMESAGRASCGILTAASPRYAKSLFAMIGSLRCNWPDHPPLLVYSLGLDENTLETLTMAGVTVRKVPPFCSHWRQHFTWKIWACHDAPFDSYLWVDTGLWVLRPFPEVFVAIQKMGYFVRSDDTFFSNHACPALIRNLSVTDDELASIININAGIHGLCKSGTGRFLIEEAMRLALCEENLKAVAPRQLHDQSLLSILFHRYFHPLFFADRGLYAGERGPECCKGQKLWHHRGKTLKEDAAFFAEQMGAPSGPHMPGPVPAPAAPSILKKIRVRIAKIRGRFPEPVSLKNEVYDGVRD